MSFALILKINSSIITLKIKISALNTNNFLARTVFDSTIHLVVYAQFNNFVPLLYTG